MSIKVNGTFLYKSLMDNLETKVVSGTMVETNTQSFNTSVTVPSVESGVNVLVGGTHQKVPYSGDWNADRIVGMSSSSANNNTITHSWYKGAAPNWYGPNRVRSIGLYITVPNTGFLTSKLKCNGTTLPNPVYSLRTVQYFHSVSSGSSVVTLTHDIVLQPNECVSAVDCSSRGEDSTYENDRLRQFDSLTITDNNTYNNKTERTVTISTGFRNSGNTARCECIILCYIMKIDAPKIKINNLEVNTIPNLKSFVVTSGRHAGTPTYTMVLAHSLNANQFITGVSWGAWQPTGKYENDQLTSLSSVNTRRNRTNVTFEPGWPDTTEYSNKYVAVIATEFLWG